MSEFNDKCLQTIDSKGRLQLAKQVRERFRLKKGDLLYLLPSSESPPYLEVRTKAQWAEYQGRFLEQAPGELKRHFIRFVELYKETVVADAQGRISIPKRLRETCKLDGEIIVLNIPFCVEVWNKDYIDQKQSDFAKAFKDINNLLQ